MQRKKSLKMKIEDLLTSEDLNKIPPPEIENYIEHSQYNDQRFGEMTLLCHKTEQKSLVMKEKISHSLDEFYRDVYQAKERVKISHDNILKMISYSSTEDKDSNSYSVTAYYEYPSSDMKLSIQKNLENSQNNFTGNFLINMITQISQSLGYLQKNKMIHGDVRPKFIAIFKTRHLFKIMDRLSDPSSPVKVQLNWLKQEGDLYMSPLLFKFLRNGVKKFMHNPYKSDVFSLGLCALEAGLGESVQGIYDFENNVV